VSGCVKSAWQTWRSFAFLRDPLCSIGALAVGLRALMTCIVVFLGNDAAEH
jgi:hypothetical protein